MTVGDLIEHLKKYPPHLPVIFRRYSEYEALDAADICPVDREQRVLTVRGGRYVRAYPPSQYPPDENPVYVSALTFPGN